MLPFELEWVEWLQHGQAPMPPTRLGIGDDMAIVDTPSGPLLVSSDMSLDGVHFDTSRHPLLQIGRKAVACSLSDCAAMAVRPLAVTLSAALPKSMSFSQAKEFFEGAQDMAKQFRTAVVGGDTARWEAPMAIDVGIVATPYPGVQPVTRSGAVPGDGLYISGSLGGSLWGKHLSFLPRVREAHRLAQTLGSRLHAMIDVSDGLSLDLWRLCQASGVGAILDEDLLSEIISDDARKVAAEDGVAPLQHALCDGEDFELLAAIEGALPPMDVALHRVGSVAPEGLSLRRSDGRIVPLEPKGFVH